jgi:hypothetical protein
MRLKLREKEIIRQKRVLYKAYHEWAMSLSGLPFKHYVMLAYSDEISMEYWEIEIDYLQVFGKEG